MLSPCGDFRRPANRTYALRGLHVKQYSRGFVVATYWNSLPHRLHVADLGVPRSTCRFRSLAAYRCASMQNRRLLVVGLKTRRTTHKP